MIPQAGGTSLHANSRGQGTSVCGVAEVRKAPGPQKGGGRVDQNEAGELPGPYLMGPGSTCDRQTLAVDYQSVTFP